MAQKRRKEQQLRMKQRRMNILCIAGGIGAIVLSLVICLLVFDIGPKEAPAVEAASQALPFKPTDPFTLADLTPKQLNQLRTEGQIKLSDGPRGISVGDSLDKLLSHYPSTSTRASSLPKSTGMQSDEQMTDSLDAYFQNETAQMGDQTGLQSDEETILYCADYFENQNGVMTALPPRGLLTVDTGDIVVTLLAPTSPYPAGTKDSYRSYEHVYCTYTIAPDTMTVREIHLGLSR